MQNRPNQEVEQLAALDKRLARSTRRALRDIVPRSKGATKGDSWRRPAQDLLDVAAPDHLTHHLLRRIERQDLKVTRGLSFRSFMVQESESRRLGMRSTSWMLDQKISAYEFIDTLGVRRPLADLNVYKFRRLPRHFPSVVKPVRGTGSRGCYLVYSESEIVHVRDGAQFNSWTDMATHAKQLMGRGAAQALPDRWFIEELILEDKASRTPAPDLKYFTFYGQVVMVLEVRREMGRSRYSFMLPDNTPIRPGTWDYEYYEGTGTNLEHLQLVEEISREIPHPFSRIDMLKGEMGLVFGEFTPRPGQFQNFSDDWDRTLGEAWVRAQSRLQNDLLNGKRFDAFMRSTGYAES